MKGTMKMSMRTTKKRQFFSVNYFAATQRKNKNVQVLKFFFINFIINFF